MNKDILESHRHMVLYMKGHYQENNLFDDLRRIISHRSGIAEEYIYDRDIYQQVVDVFLAAASDYELKSTLYELFCPMFGNKTVDMTDMIKKMRLSIRHTMVKNEEGEILIDLGKADPEVLPLISSQINSTTK